MTDASGAAIPGATVTVTDEAKGTSVTAKSNESGGYSIEHLIPDLYTVKVEATGFKGFETNHLQLLADTSPKVDAAMQTGGASETVNVNADAIPQLKTDRADVATTFDSKESCGSAGLGTQLYQFATASSRRTAAGLEPRRR